jgi:hypothetical protein
MIYVAIFSRGGKTFFLKNVFKVIFYKVILVIFMSFRHIIIAKGCGLDVILGDIKKLKKNKFTQA